MSNPTSPQGGGAAGPPLGQAASQCQLPGCTKAIFPGSNFCSKSHREYVESSHNTYYIGFLDAPSFVVAAHMLKVPVESLILLLHRHQAWLSLGHLTTARLSWHLSVSWMLQTCLFRKHILLQVPSRVRRTFVLRQFFPSC